MVCVCNFDVIHKAVNHAMECILHGRQAKKMFTKTDGGKHSNSRVNSIGMHQPAVFSWLE